MDKSWYIFFVVGCIIAVVCDALNLSLIKYSIVMIIVCLIVLNFDGSKTDVRIDQLEERIKNLENKL